jgi:hypothetical protein
MGLYQISTEHRYKQAVGLYFLLLLALRFFGGKFLTDLYGQPMISSEYSYTFWAVLYTGIPKYIISHYPIALLMDIAVVLLPMGLVLSRSHIRTWTALSLLVFFLHTVTGEVYSCAHSKSVVLVFLVLLPLLFQDRKFLLMVDFAKYFGIGVLLSAAYYKVVNGALLTPDNYLHVLINKHADLAVVYPESFIYQLAQHIIAHPVWADVLFKMLFVTQLTFALSLFSRRFDKLLILPLAAFSITTYIFMGIYNFDILILFAPLWFSWDIGELYGEG